MPKFKKSTGYKMSGPSFFGSALKQKKEDKKEAETVAGQYLEKKKGVNNVYYDVDYPEREYKAKEGTVTSTGGHVDDEDYVVKGDSIVGVKGSKEYPFAEDE